MKILFIVNPVAGGWEPDDVRLGGSERCIVEWATRLARSHDVEVYHNPHVAYERPRTLLGVRYRNREDYTKYRGDGITVNVNYPDLPPIGPTIFWTSLDNHRGHTLAHYDEVLALSQWQADNTDIHPVVTGLLPPGYDSAVLKPGHDKIPHSVLYASSPDRGLEFLEAQWPKVIAQVPDAELWVTYEGRGDSHNIMCLGAVEENMMNQLFLEADIWVHPAANGELYCMSGINAQAAGCVPVVFPTMALVETVRHGVFTNEDDFAGDMVKTLRAVNFKNAIRRRLAAETYPDWESTTNLLEQYLLKHYNKA